jgi:predicted ATPase
MLEIPPGQRDGHREPVSWAETLWESPESREMLNVPQHEFRSTQLDPDLLSTPFKTQTNWHVIAGAPSSGKTTLINQLANKGFQTVPEGARLYIEAEMAKKGTIHPIFQDGAALQRTIAEMQLGIESDLRPADVAFLDGALPGCLAWYRAFGLNPNEILRDTFRHRYASVFVLDPLPFQPDDGRPGEVAALADFLDEWLARDYSALGYDVVRVPVLALEERLAFVLDWLSQQGLI